MQELAISFKSTGTPADIEANVKYSLSLGLREFTMAPCAHAGTFIICGSSPSLKDYIEAIRQDQHTGHPICAVKGAYDFLREHDITPDLYISVEPRYRPIKDPSDHSTYMLASRCNPQDFDELLEKHLCLLLWHSWTNVEEPCYAGLMGVGGGSTSGLRAINIAYLLGFKRIKIYGMDSCLMEGEKRVGQGVICSKVKTIGIKVGADDDAREFRATMAMAAQSQDFQMIWEIMPGLKIEVMGDGLLAAICEQRKQTGLPV